MLASGFNNFPIGSWSICAVIDNATMDILTHESLYTYKCISVSRIYGGQTVRSQSLEIKGFYTSQVPSRKAELV